MGFTIPSQKAKTRLFIHLGVLSTPIRRLYKKKVWGRNRLSAEGNLAKPANEQTLQHHTRKDIAVATAQAMPIPGGRVVVIPVCFLKIAKFYQLGLAKHFH